MRYYKIIINSNIVGIGTTIDLRKFQEKHKIWLSCDESEAQYIQCQGRLYHALWMLPVTVDKDQYQIAEVKEIAEDQFTMLYDAMKSGTEIQEPLDDNDDEKAPDIDSDEQMTIDYIMNAKINEMRADCNKTITSGFDEKLSDGQTYHFTLTLQDQLNLITSYQMVLDGFTEIPYHADGELCKYYTASDMKKIVEKTNSFKTYHIAYFNSLRDYIKSLQDIKDISAIVYGVAIPEEYQSEVLKSFR